MVEDVTYLNYLALAGAILLDPNSKHGKLEGNISLGVEPALQKFLNAVLPSKCCPT